MNNLDTLLSKRIQLGFSKDSNINNLYDISNTSSSVWDASFGISLTARYDLETKWDIEYSKLSIFSNVNLSKEWSMNNKIYLNLDDMEVNGVVLSMPIVDEVQFHDPNALKIIHNMKNDILYTSRAPIPYCKEWSLDIGAKRIYGIFGFKWAFLKKFTQMPESPLELVESCDSNRLYDNGLTQRVALYPYVDSFCVDTPEDAAKVEAYLENDPYWRKYIEQ